MSGPPSPNGAASPGSRTIIPLMPGVARATGERRELVIVDDESKPDVARRKTEKMVQEDNIDVHVGGFLSNICLACMPVWEEAKIVNMITVCLDTTLTTTKCNRYSFRPYDYAPAQAVAFAPTLTKMGKKWHIAHADYAWGQSTRDAYIAEIKKNGGEVVGMIALVGGASVFCAPIVGRWIDRNGSDAINLLGFSGMIAAAAILVAGHLVQAVQ